MISFICSHWRAILVIVCSIISVISSIMIRFVVKHPVLNKLDNIKMKVLEKLPGWINSAESLKDGSAKKSLVLSAIVEYCKEQFSITLPAWLLTYFSNMLEEILSTPHKKEDL